MRIAFISRRFFPAISGMSIYAANLTRELSAAGHEVVLFSQYYSGEHAGVYGGGPPPLQSGMQVIGIESVGEQERGDFETDIAILVDVIVAQHQASPFDILHAQYGYPTGWAAMLASQRIGIPVIVSIQGGDGHWVGSCCETHLLAMQRTCLHSSALLIGGESFAREVADRLDIPRSRFTLVPGAVDTSRFTPSARVAASPCRLLYHGRVDRRKGVLDFIQALAGLDASVPAWTATISGIGPDLQAARELAATLGLTSERLRFSGYANYDQAPTIYQAHDIFVSPTYSEGFSNTILEAMASGLPVLSCQAVGVVDCVRHAENGWLVMPGDVAALSSALALLIGDRDLRDRLAANALKQSRLLYSWKAVSSQIMSLYNHLSGTRPDSAFDAALPMTDCRFRRQPHLL